MEEDCAGKGGVLAGSRSTRQCVRRDRRRAVLHLLAVYAQVLCRPGNMEGEKVGGVRQRASCRRGAGAGAGGTPAHYPIPSSLTNPLSHPTLLTRTGVLALPNTSIMYASMHDAPAGSSHVTTNFLFCTGGHACVGRSLRECHCGASPASAYTHIGIQIHST